MEPGSAEQAEQMEVIGVTTKISKSSRLTQTQASLPRLSISASMAYGVMLEKLCAARYSIQLLCSALSVKCLDRVLMGLVLSASTYRKHHVFSNIALI